MKCISIKIFNEFGTAIKLLFCGLFIKRRNYFYKPKYTQPHHTLQLSSLNLASISKTFSMYTTNGDFLHRELNHF